MTTLVRRAETPGASPSRHGPLALSISPAVILWLAAGVASNFAGPPTAQLLLSTLGLLHSVVVFLLDGRGRLSSPGIYCLAAGLFIFFPGLYLCFDETTQHISMAPVAALNISYSIQVLLYDLVWKPRRQQIADAGRVWSDAAPSVTTLGMACGVVLIVLGIIGSVREIEPTILVNAAAYTGVVLLALASFKRAKPLGPLAYGFVAAALAAYATYIFTGFGRLTLGSLGLAVVMAVSHRWKGRTAKVLTVLVIPPALLFLARARVSFISSLYPRQAVTQNGLESVVAPFVRFSELLVLEGNGRLVHTYGHSFYAAAVSLIPRSIWPDKPIGLGAELAHFFSPQLDGTGHSEAALFTGEWLFAFGFLGILAMVPVVGYLVVVLDRSLVRAEALRGGLGQTRDLLMVLTLTIVASSIVDLMWGGAFTYVSRVGSRLLFVGLLFVLFARHKKTPAAKPPQERPGASGGFSHHLGAGAHGGRAAYGPAARR